MREIILIDIKLLEVGYYLSRLGIDGPPLELKVNNWKEAYQCFAKTLKLNKTEEQFENSLKNIRDHYDAYLPNNRAGWHNQDGNPDRLPAHYKFILENLSKLSDAQLWEYIQPYASINVKQAHRDLYWKFDISTFRLLGRELITDRITALVELVKNSYDANAKNIYIKFIKADQPKNGKIILCDDGFGMSSDDIETKWMTIGTNSKRKNTFSPKPFERRVVGEKGVGRFAIDKLGSHCKIFTKTVQESNINILTINWETYAQNDQTDNFLEVKNHLEQRKLFTQTSGVKIVITNLHDIWTHIDLDRVYKEMAKIVSPFNTLYPPFNIYISSKQHDKYKNETLVKNDAVKYASEKFLLKYNLESKTQQVISFTDGQLIVKDKPIFNFGPVKFQLYYFDQYAKGNFSKNYKGAEQQIDGIKIYRDGILTTPFAEHQAHQDHKRDILGIDKRRWSGFFDKISSRDMIGILEIQKDLSPKIIDSTNRQDFIDNQEYRDLKDFIIGQIAELEKYLKHKKTEHYKIVSENLEDARNQLDDFSSELKSFKEKLNRNAAVDVNEEIKKLEKTARKANIALKQGLKKQQEEREESERKESMFMSLMSLQTYALEITHIIKTSLGHIKRRAEFNLKYFNHEKFQPAINDYNHEIIQEIDKLNQAIEFMSTYTRSEKNWESFNINQTISSVFESYRPIFQKEDIETKIEIQNNIVLEYNSHLLEDIIKNLINNSIKALKAIDKKIIKISGFVENDALTIVFSDNGVGIPEKNKEKVYEIYYTTTAEEGGNGMGLYMIKTNLAAIKGHIELVNSELEHGASFKLTFPFKRL